MERQAAWRARRINLADPHIGHWYSRRAAEASLARYSPLSFIATLQASHSGAGNAAIRARGYNDIGLGDELHVTLLQPKLAGESRVPCRSGAGNAEGDYGSAGARVW